MIAKETKNAKTKKRVLTVFFENGELKVFMANGVFNGQVVKILPRNKHLAMSLVIKHDKDINEISSKISCRNKRMEMRIGSLSVYMLDKKGETIIRNPRGNILVVGWPKDYKIINALHTKIQKK